MAYTSEQAFATYSLIAGNLLANAANKDLDVALFMQEFATQKLSLGNTTYGKTVEAQAAEYMSWLQDQLLSVTGPLQQEYQQGLTNIEALRTGMNATIDDVVANANAEEAAQQQKRAHVTPEQQGKTNWDRLPAFFKWGLSPSIPLPGTNWGIPIPYFPFGRGVSFG